MIKDLIVKDASVYIHLAGEDVDKAQCLLNGITKSEKQEATLRPKICRRCETKNSAKKYINS